MRPPPQPKAPNSSEEQPALPASLNEVVSDAKRWQPHSEAQEAEIVAGLGATRSAASRSWPKRALAALAENASIEDHEAGAVLEGSEVWLKGTCVVLSGEASVVLTVPRGRNVAPTDVVLASLQWGDTFGWPSRQRGLSNMAEEDSEASWEKCCPRIVVCTQRPLRFCRLHNEEEVVMLSKRDPSKGTYLNKRSSGTDLSPDNLRKYHVGQSGAVDPEDTQRLLLSDRLAHLWLSSSAPVDGLGDLPVSMPRAHFHAALWVPLLDRLEEYKDEIRRRKRLGLRIHDCFPLQGHQIVELKEHVRHTTSIWYGSKRGGNMSLVYRWFNEAMDLLGVTAYSYDAIPKETSPDGWAVVVDAGARGAALKGKSSSDHLYVATGGVAQRQGRSAIDNTVLSNLFLPHEARELLVGRRLRKMLCHLFAARQRVILRKLSEHTQMGLLWMGQTSGSERGHRLVREVLRSISLEEVRAAGVEPDGICFRQLCIRGSVIAGYGQLEPDEQKVLWQEARRLLNFRYFESRMTTLSLSSISTAMQNDAVQSASAESEDIFERLVAWCRAYPGEFFDHSKQQHHTVMIAGILSSKIVVIRRSAMERWTLARYVPLSWRRSQPLWGSSASGPFLARPGSVNEVSHVRANECPYATLHGMSLSGGGFASDQTMKKGILQGFSLLMELQWVRDPSANVENWYIIDIEKILQEAWQLNPRGPKEMMLPGEGFTMVGQNPKVGSSIRQTQHTQLCEGSISNYPVLSIPSSIGPRFSRKIGAYVDLMDVGPAGTPPEQCGLIIKVQATNPTLEALLKFMVDLRYYLIANSADAESMDFLVNMLSDEQGGFVVIFAPIPQLMKMGTGHPDLSTWVNPLTGESSDSAGLEESRVDFGKGVGHFLVAKEALKVQLLANGEDTVRRIWAFNRIPGIRIHVDKFMEEQEIFQDPCEEAQAMIS